MSGEVNEAMNMIAAQVMINHVGLTVAICMANLKFNVFKPLMIKYILHSIRIISDVCISFNDHLTDDATLITHQSTTTIEKYGTVHIQNVFIPLSGLARCVRTLSTIFF